MKKRSFPTVKIDQVIAGLRRGRRWQVICGDRDHYRVGLYSPEIAGAHEIREFEKHSCDEFFILLEGRVSLALMHEMRGRQKIKVISLQPLRPVLVRTWHAGFCPDGPFTRLALVVERDQFSSRRRRSKF